VKELGRWCHSQMICVDAKLDEVGNKLEAVQDQYRKLPWFLRKPLRTITRRYRENEIARLTSLLDEEATLFSAAVLITRSAESLREHRGKKAKIEKASANASGVEIYRVDINKIGIN